MNDTIDHQLAHRTIRRFTPEAVDAGDLSTLIAVARQTATSSGGQLSSIIRLTNPAVKRGLAEIAGQAYIADAPELWVMIVDLNRAAHVVAEKGADAEPVGGMDSFFQGFTDAILAAQNVVTAAESMGYGTCFLGSILNDPHALIELLRLPRLTFPALGLMIGRPAQSPQLKPRMPMDLRVSENTYTELDEPYLETLSEYDAQMTTYYDLRDANRRVDSYTDQLTRLVTRSMPKRLEILAAVRDQGFNLAV